MRYKPLGRTGLFVSELSLGTMTFGGTAGIWSRIGDLQQGDAERLIGQAIDAGVNLIDTADIYAEGRSEQITGQALRNLRIARDRILIATKVFGATGPDPNAAGATRHHILYGAKESLRRLQLDHIDLYQIHGFDPATPIDETMQALDQLVRQGDVRYVGVSNWAAWQIAKAHGISERRGLCRLESLQAYYSVAGRDLERELVPMLKSERVGLLVWSPLAGGLLSGKTDGRRTAFEFPPVDMNRASRCIEVMRAIGERHDASIARIALAWLLHQPAVTSVIIGAKREAQLQENLAASTLKLSAEELAQIDAVSRLPAEYPGWIFEPLGGGRRKRVAQSHGP